MVWNSPEPDSWEESSTSHNHRLLPFALPPPFSHIPLASLLAMAKSKAQKKANPSAASAPAQAAQRKSTAGPSKAAPKSKSGAATAPKPADDLRQIIQDLGGDDEDYALVNGLDDDDDDEDVVGDDEVVDVSHSFLPSLTSFCFVCCLDASRFTGRDQFPKKNCLVPSRSFVGKKCSIR